MNYKYMGLESLAEGLQMERPVVELTIRQSDTNFICTQCDKRLTDHTHSILDKVPVFNVCLPRFAKALLFEKCQ